MEMTDQDPADFVVDDACFPHFHRLHRLIHQLARIKQSAIYDGFLAQSESGPSNQDFRWWLDQDFGDYWFRIARDGNIHVYLVHSSRWLASLSPEGTPAVRNKDGKERIINLLIPALETELVLDQLGDL